VQVKEKEEKEGARVLNFKSATVFCHSRASRKAKSQINQKEMNDGR